MITYAHNLLDQSFLDRYFGTFDGADGRADPGDKSELGPLAQLIASINSNERE